MTQLLHQLLLDQASETPTASAVGDKSRTLTYQELSSLVSTAATNLLRLGLERNERIAIFLPKRIETVISFFAATAAGGVFVPVNPILKAEQAKHILTDCNVRVLITNKARLKQLEPLLDHCHDLRQIILVDDVKPENSHPTLQVLPWSELDSEQRNTKHSYNKPLTIDTDMAAILYTSGSTGKPKGVVLSHRNMVTGAYSVAEYLKNSSSDRLLCVLPFSFDYGLSQLTTAFASGASCYLIEYLLPNDILKACQQFKITGLAAVPPLWLQLAELDWPQEASQHLRYFTNSGGAMPSATLKKLQNIFPKAHPYLMYGLTEAFRSSYLPPHEVTKRPTSMGRAIPNAELLVINDAGEHCKPHEPGELVHRGSLVALGYWNDSERTQERFKPAPLRPGGIPTQELAVWSGDTVKTDEDGFLYFVGRKDDMIKTSGYRVSPTEVEETLYSSGLLGEAVAVGIPHKKLGQAILVVATPNNGADVDTEALLKNCRKELPNFMVPHSIQIKSELPRNSNGKIDRKSLSAEFENLFEDEQ